MSERGGVPREILTELTRAEALSRARLLSSHGRSRCAITAMDGDEELWSYVPAAWPRE